MITKKWFQHEEFQIGDLSSRLSTPRSHNLRPSQQKPSKGIKKPLERRFGGNFKIRNAAKRTRNSADFRRSVGPRGPRGLK